LVRIRSEFPDMSTKEQQIARFILDSPKQVSILGQQQISDACDVSQASVSRFAARFGFASFRVFQIALSSSSQGEADSVDDELFTDEPPEQIINKLFEINRLGLRDTESILDKADLIRIAQAIARARQVIVIGLSCSGVIARDCEIRLGHLGVQARAITDPIQMASMVDFLGKQDLLLAVSHTGRTRPVVWVVERAGECGVPTVAITNFSLSPLAQKAQTVLLTAYRERTIHAAHTSSHIAQLCLLDCLYFLVSQIKGVEIHAQVKDIEPNLEDAGLRM
jgi:DNA-binding MurR/RpiR family transcriptional regulator